MPTLIATAPHRSEFPRPISVEAGTRLTVGRRSEGSQGWVPLRELAFIDERTTIAKGHDTARELDVDVGGLPRCARTL